jgi:cytochrome c
VNIALVVGGPIAAAVAVGLGLAGATRLVPGAPEGDAARGEQVYERCAACHSLAHDRTGPRHCGLIGRRAGSVPGFEYSAAMRSSGLVWDASTLERFLASPMAVVPGTSMGYAGVDDAAARRDLVAYLHEAGSQPACRG